METYAASTTVYIGSTFSSSSPMPVEAIVDDELDLPRPTQKPTVNLHGFDVHDEKSDVVIIVDEHKLYLNKGILSYASPVFDRMFHAEFKEKSQTDISLPGKTCNDFVAFLLCIYPNTMEEITLKNIEQVLPLADEYQVEKLKKRCDVFLTEGLNDDVEVVKGKRSSHKQLVHSIVLATKFSLDTTLAKALDLAVKRRFVNLKKENEFAEIPDKTKVELLSRRVEYIEKIGLPVCNATVQLVRAMPEQGLPCKHKTNTKKYCYATTCENTIVSSTVFEKLEILGDMKDNVESFFKILCTK